MVDVAFKNFTPFIKCIRKTNGATINDAGDLDLVMPIYNLLEHSSNYFENTGSLWLYSKNEEANFNTNPLGMRRRRDISFRSHIGREVTDHAET